ncbi:hypothetical protein [Halorarius litoreus]|uniref:hypothetical protein n=1 Tax=Halorarius litoreus TaxID=2962676 RepID=UPI0020CBD15D|nr:hypothetical protein [Halorarius litoreus]
MLWTRYRLLGFVGAVCLLGSWLLADPLAPGLAPGALGTFVGAELLLLAGYAGLNGARPVRGTLAALNSHLVVYTGFVAVTVLQSPQLPLPEAAFARLPLLLVLAPIPAAFSLGASSRAADRGPYVLGAAVVAVAGPVVANTLLRWVAGVPEPELETLTAAAVGVVAALPPYLTARRRKPGFRDEYPGLDDLPVSRATLTVTAWLLFVVSGWGPFRVASGTAFQRAWGIIPPESVLAIPFLGLMATVGVFAVGIVDSEAVVERLFGVGVVLYLLGAVAAYAFPLLDVDLDPPRYLGFASVVLVSLLALAVLYRRVR